MDALYVRRPATAEQKKGAALVQVIAHRGASAHAPENTFAAFDRALELGVSAFETDVQCTRDGVLVLMHDHTVDRTTDGRGAVRDFTWAEVAALDAGAWFGDRFQGQRVPRLNDFLDRYGDRVHYALEIKAFGVEEEVLQAVRERGLLPRVTFTSFSYETCCRLREVERAARVGFLYRRTSRPLAASLRVAGLVQACPNAALLTSADVTTIRTEGLEVRAWGVADDELMRKIVALGVDGATVDFPDRLQALLRCVRG